MDEASPRAPGRTPIWLVVTVGLVATAGMIWWVNQPRAPATSPTQRGSAEAIQTRVHLGRLAGALHLQAAFDDGRHPPDTESLPPSSQAYATDGWGRPMRWEATAERLTITSAGADGAWDTVDDLRWIER